MQQRVDSLTERSRAILETRGTDSSNSEAAKQVENMHDRIQIPEEQKRRMQLIIAEQSATIDANTATLRSLQETMSQLQI